VRLKDLKTQLKAKIERCDFLEKENDALKRLCESLEQERDYLQELVDRGGRG